MVLGYYGGEHSVEEIFKLAKGRLTGTLASGLAEAARFLNYNAQMLQDIGIGEIRKWTNEGEPIIALVNPSVLYNHSMVGTGHFIVLNEIDEDIITYSDPDVGPNIEVSLDRFELAWSARGRKVVRIWRR